MGRFLGQLSTEKFGITLKEMRVGRYDITAAQAATAAAVRAAITGSSEAAVVKTDAITNPAYPRNLVVTPGGTTADVKAGNVVIAGTNILDEPISENFAFLDNATEATTGNKAFKTITSITIPIQDGNAATFAVTTGEKLGLPFMLDHNTLFRAIRNGAVEANAPTVAVDDDEIEKNTVTMHSALNGQKLELYFML